MSRPGPNLRWSPKEKKTIVSDRLYDDTHWAGTECAPAGALGSCGACAASHQGSMSIEVNEARERAPQSVPVSILILAKSWSEWQDLNLRPPRPQRVLYLPPRNGSCLQNTFVPELFPIHKMRRPQSKHNCVRP
jgi:hypothetical protein